MFIIGFFQCLLLPFGLLFGILRSEEICLHREDTRFNQNPRIGNHDFNNVLKEYEEFHKMSTGGGSTKVIEEDLLCGNETSVKNKYLYLELNASGLGNRLNTILSGFLLAVLTNRVLLIHSDDYDFNDIFCQPFPGSDWIWPRTLKWSSVVESHSWKSFTLQGYDGVGMEEFITEKLDNNDYVKQRQIIRYREGEIYFLPVLYLHPPFQRLLLHWFPAHNPGTVLAHYLLHPQNNIWNKVVTTFTTLVKPSPSDFAVGVQLRNGAFASSFRNCISERYNTQHHNEQANRTRFFVASMFDAKEYLPLQQMNSHWEVIQLTVEGTEKHNTAQTAHALHEIWVLSLTDELLISPASTFGYFSMMLKGTAASIFLPNTTAATESKLCPFAYQYSLHEEQVCVPMTSTEACFHRRFYMHYLGELYGTNHTKHVHESHPKPTQQQQQEGGQGQQLPASHPHALINLFMPCEDACHEEQGGYRDGMKLRTIT